MLFPAPPLIRLLPLLPDPPGAELIAWLASELGERLGVEVEILPPFDQAEEWRRAYDAQLSSERIVDALVGHFPPEDDVAPGWVLAVTSSDLRGQDREFVFGEAALGGRWAVISTARLGAAGGQQFRPRLLREALHELGHLAGLDHCDDPQCLMASAADVVAIDRRGTDPCSGCRSLHSGT